MSDFLAQKQSDENPAFSSTLESGGVAGAGIGPYHLLELIGTGGMGDVWLAEQKQPVWRRVALKLIKAGMDTREVVARFESERQALALMDHPAIAKVFDAGSTPQGRPYFVMEYVAGIPITTYCDRYKLTTRERLELFIHVCEGIQHAHQKAIIHRDLKPSNILVTEVDGKPAPKIIDFGVAKAIAQRLTEETMFTRVGALLGTPEYMSPEQADSAGVDIDTRTDVYSLGVVLYELLVGAVPLEFKKLPFDEMLRKLREEDTPRPSTKVKTTSKDSSTAAENRRTDVRSLARQLRGDLDAITLKAVEKDRARRYGTPSELAADIGRYLRNEPVVARPASVAYRAGKYIRRHRIGVAVAAGLVVLLAAFAVAQAVQLRRITRERDRADRITNFMTSMFKVSDPSEARGNKVTAREILDKASKEIDKGLANDPELQAQMMNVMGGVYDSLGLYSRAASLLTRVVEIRRRILGPENAATLRSLSLLSGVLMREGHYPEAETLARQTLETQQRVLGLKHRDTLTSMNQLGSILGGQRKDADAEQVSRTALGIERSVLGSENPETLISMNILAEALMAEHRYAQAEKLFRESIDIERRTLGPEHPEILNSMNGLALTLKREGRYTETEELERETLELSRRILGPEHPHTLIHMSNLANTVADRGDYAEAERLDREVLRIQRQVLGPEHPYTAVSVYNLGCLAARRGKKDEALSLVREAVDHGGAPALARQLEKDTDLNSLHSDPRFTALVAYAKQKAAAAQSK